MHYFVFLASLINPVYILPLTIVELIKKKSTYLPAFSFALAFAFVSFELVPPINYDIYRHYLRIESLNGLPLDLIIKNSSTGYLLFDTYAWLINTLRLPLGTLNASIVFLAYFLVFTIFKDLKDNWLGSSRSSYIALSFFLLWQSITFVMLTSGIRSQFAATLLVYASYKLFYYKKTSLFLVLSLVAFFIHPFSLGISAIIYTSTRLIFLSRWSKTFIIVGFLASLIPSAISYIINLIILVFNKFDFFRASYFDPNSTWAKGVIESKNINGLIVTFFVPRLPFYISQIYLIINKPKSHNAYYTALCLISLYLGVFHSFYTLFDRMAVFYYLLFTLYLITREASRTSKLSKQLYYTYFISIVLYSIINLYRYKDFLLTAKTVMFKPMLFSFFGV